jgi:hypothetical protein
MSAATDATSRRGDAPHNGGREADETWTSPSCKGKGRKARHIAVRQAPTDGKKVEKRDKTIHERTTRVVVTPHPDVVRAVGSCY